MDNIREKLVELIEECTYYTYKETACVADHLIANGVTIGKDIAAPTKWIPVTEQEWVRVKDRLPEKSGEYLTYCVDYDGVCIIYYEVLKTKGKWRTRWKEVTHWMPLPTPPKGEENG